MAYKNRPALQCRKLIVDAVLATDMVVHFDLVKNFNDKVAAESDINAWGDRTLLYQMLIHLADIGNPSRPFPLARAWAERVIQEFCEQVRVWGLSMEHGLHAHCP